MFLRARVEPRPPEGVIHVAESVNFTYSINSEEQFGWVV